MRAVLNELFPRFAEIAGEKTWQFRNETTKRESEDKRISNPEMFSAYFRYELPDAIFSSVEFEAFVRRSERAAAAPQQADTLLEELRSMEKGSLRRDDFLRKIADSIPTQNLQLARSWTVAAVRAADDVTYDTFTGLGEAGHIARMIIRFAQRLTKTGRVKFLSECIEIAADDTLAFRVLTTLTNAKSDANLGVQLAQVYPSFIKRMRSRYGRDVDVAQVDLATSDPRAFNFWGFRDTEQYSVKADPEDREIQHDFWERYIGQSKARLIKTFNEMLMPAGVYESDPEPYVENKMSVDLIRKLFNELPDDYDPSDLPMKYIKRLRRFLNGDFKKGIGIGQIDDSDDTEGRSDDDGLAPTA